VSELLDVDVTAAGSGEQQGRVDSRGHRIKRLEDDLPQRHCPDRAVRLAALFENTSGEAPANVEKVLLAVDVSAFQGEQFLRT